MKNRHALRSKNNYSYGMHQPTDATDGEADDEGREPRRHERLAHLMALRALTRGPGKHVILMDEADDVLTLDREDRGLRSKLWLNNLVEHCDTPTIWILNQPRRLEESLVS